MTIGIKSVKTNPCHRSDAIGLSVQIYSEEICCIRVIFRQSTFQEKALHKPELAPKHTETSTCLLEIWVASNQTPQESLCFVSTTFLFEKMKLTKLHRAFCFLLFPSYFGRSFQLQVWKITTKMPTRSFTTLPICKHRFQLYLSILWLIIAETIYLTFLLCSSTCTSRVKRQ